MKCFKCGKEMTSLDGEGANYGLEVNLTQGEPRTKEAINYFNLQFGKYGDGKGECHVAICHECYIDGLFHLIK